MAPSLSQSSCNSSLVLVTASPLVHFKTEISLILVREIIYKRQAVSQAADPLSMSFVKSKEHITAYQDLAAYQQMFKSRMFLPPG